jgi:hypothetical protein
MPNAFGKSIDKTFLSVDLAEERGFLHRDYIAHCFRWSHVVKFLNERKRYTTSHILDVGCGRETPLLKTLYSSRLIPASYTGVDVGPINDPGSALMSKFPVELYPNTSVLDIQTEVQGAWGVIVMFEALEHMEPEMGRQVLEHLQRFMLPDNTTLFLSTPCYDGTHKAANHVYEWGYEELREQLDVLGFKITNVWGTFASIKDYKSQMSNYLLSIFDELREYYDSNVLSVIFAPLFPAKSRNCLWQLTT